MWLDWVAGITEAIGLYIVGSKNRWGFVLNFICCICWILYVILTRSTYGILAITVPAFFINIRNFVRWTREAKQKDKPGA